VYVLGLLDFIHVEVVWFDLLILDELTGPFIVWLNLNLSISNEIHVCNKQRLASFLFLFWRGGWFVFPFSLSSILGYLTYLCS